MFLLIFVSSWLISIGFKFWMIEAAFAPIGQAEICSFMVPSFLLETAHRAVAVVAADMLAAPDCSVPVRLSGQRTRQRSGLSIAASLTEYFGDGPQCGGEPVDCGKEIPVEDEQADRQHPSTSHNRAEPIGPFSCSANLESVRLIDARRFAKV